MEETLISPNMDPVQEENQEDLEEQQSDSERRISSRHSTSRMDMQNLPSTSPYVLDGDTITPIGFTRGKFSAVKKLSCIMSGGDQLHVCGNADIIGTWLPTWQQC